MNRIERAERMLNKGRGETFVYVRRDDLRALLRLAKARQAPITMSVLIEEKDALAALEEQVQ